MDVKLHSYRDKFIDFHEITSGPYISGGTFNIGSNLASLPN